MSSQDWADLMLKASIWIIAIVALRPIVIWYFKIDQLIEHLRGIRNGEREQPVPPQAAIKRPAS